jgi:hypothetical protein
MTPLPPGALEQLLQTLPPERPDPFPHLADLSPDALLQRRVEITGQIKSLEAERQAIDAELSEVFSPAELRSGIRAPGGWVLQQRSRTSWDYAPEVREAIKGLQKQAQRSGKAQKCFGAYLVMLRRERT